MEKLNSKELKQWKDQNENFFLINVLPPESFAKAHIPGSHNIPVDDPNFTQKVQDLAKGKSNKIVVYCSNLECDASPTAAKKLDEAGFTEVYDFEGGMKEWEEAGYNVETGRQAMRA